MHIGLRSIALLKTNVLRTQTVRQHCVHLRCENAVFRPHLLALDELQPRPSLSADWQRHAAWKVAGCFARVQRN